jgi:hypothetical protein
MSTHLRGQALHDKATRGEQLNLEEQRELEQWYAQEDEIEADVLGVIARHEFDTNLQRQVHATLDQLQIVTRQIQELSLENDAVRREIAELQQRLA